MNGYDWSRGLTLLGAVWVSFLVHQRAGLTLPLPWPDEAAFLWPAHSLGHEGSLLAPELNGTRALLWMPPGYAGVMALVFRMVPFGLTTARWASWGSSILALVGLFWSHRAQRSSVLSLPLLGATAIVTTMVVAGNVARMEALLLAVVCLGYALLAQRRHWLALALLFAAPLVHPNGAPFFVAGLALVAARGRAAWRRPSTLELVAITASVAGWVAWMGVAVAHWGDFQIDMAFQFARKAAMAPANEWGTVRVIGPLGAAVLAAVAWWTRRREIRPTLVLATVACALPISSNEMWYQVFPDLGVVLLLAEVVDLAATEIPTARRPSRALGMALVLAVLGGGLRLLRVWHVTASPRDVPGGMAWECMQMSPVAYAQPSDLERVRAALAEHAHRSPGRRVRFEYPGEAVLIGPSPTGAYTPFTPLFTSEAATLILRHRSPHWRGCNASPAAVPPGERELLRLHGQGGDEWVLGEDSPAQEGSLHGPTSAHFALAPPLGPGFPR